jgi:uncharacterized protein YegL
MALFFLVDTSGAMMGSKIGEVNSAIEEVIPELKDLSESNADAQIKIAVLEFSSGARWITPNGPIEAENFVWNDMDASGVTDLGDACSKLNEKLSAKAFMQEASGSFAPAIFLLFEGGPTDDYKRGLEALKQNNWFKKAIKVAVAIGSDVEKSVLEVFSGSIEAVLDVHSPAMLRKMMLPAPIVSTKSPGFAALETWSAASWKSPHTTASRRPRECISSAIRNDDTPGMGVSSAEYIGSR